MILFLIGRIENEFNVSFIFFFIGPGMLEIDYTEYLRFLFFYWFK